jgi:2-hydroxychromene-2-carboxylate isomerase
MTVVRNWMALRPAKDEVKVKALRAANILANFQRKTRRSLLYRQPGVPKKDVQMNPYKMADTRWRSKRCHIDLRKNESFPLNLHLHLMN